MKFILSPVTQKGILEDPGQFFDYCFKNYICKQCWPTNATNYFKDQWWNFLDKYLIHLGSLNLTTLFASCSLGPGSNTSSTSAQVSAASNSMVDSTSSIHFHTPAHTSSSFNPSSPLHSSSSLHLSSPLHSSSSFYPSSPLHSSSTFHSSSSFYPSSPLNSSLPTALKPSYISSATRPSEISSRSLLTPSVLIQPQDLQPHTSSLIPSRPPYLAPSSSGPAQPSSGFSSQGSSPLHASPIQGNYPGNTVITNRNWNYCYICSFLRLIMPAKDFVICTCCRMKTKWKIEDDIDSACN